MHVNVPIKQHIDDKVMYHNFFGKAIGTITKHVDAKLENYGDFIVDFNDDIHDINGVGLIFRSTYRVC